MRHRWALILMGTVLLTVGCASASDTVGTGSGDGTTTSTAAVTGPTTAPARTVQSFTSPADRQAPAGSTPSTTTTTPAGDLASFCRSARPFTKRDLDSMTQFDTLRAGRLVLRFANLEKMAPAEIAPAIADMRPLVDGLDQEVKAGSVHDLASFRSWIASMRASGSPTLGRWTAAQALLVTFVQAKCT